MKYNFDEIIDRSGTWTWAIDGLDPTGEEAPKPPKDGFSIIPMWVADMSYRTYPGIPEAVIKRAQHPLFGYFMNSDDYYNGIIWWQKNRNGVDIQRKDIMVDNGILGGVTSAVSALVGQGGSVLMHAPTYIGFTEVLENNGYNIVLSELKKDENGTFRMDFDDMEAKIKANQIHCCVFCSPHNPTGRVWEKWELEKMFELFEKYNVYVVSDEIWSDLILFGNKHIPTQSAGEWAKNHTVALYAIGKTYSCAGFINSYRIIYDKWLKDKVNRQASLSHYNDLNIMSHAAYEAALTPGGAEWVDEVCAYLSKNVETFYNYMIGKGIEISKPEGTYMMYAEFGPYIEKHGITLDDIKDRLWDHGVLGQNGEPFHTPGTIRFNLAIPAPMLQDAMDRMDKYVFID